MAFIRRVAPVLMRVRAAMPALPRVRVPRLFDYLILAAVIYLLI